LRGLKQNCGRAQIFTTPKKSSQNIQTGGKSSWKVSGEVISAVFSLWWLLTKAISTLSAMREISQKGRAREESELRRAVFSRFHFRIKSETNRFSLRASFCSRKAAFVGLKTKAGNERVSSSFAGAAH